MKTYELYGASGLTVAQLLDQVSRLLDLEFQQRDSSYRGVYYRAGDPRGEHFIILANDPEDDPDEMPEPEFNNRRVLPEVNGTRRPEALRERLALVDGLALLRTETV